MFKTPRDYIIVALVLIIALLILFRKEPPLQDNSAYHKTIEALTFQKSIIGARLDSLVKRSSRRALQDSINTAQKNKEISQLKVKLSKQRPPVTLMADSVPELKAFIATQDSLIAATEQKADTLQMALTSQLETIIELRTLVIDKDKIEDQMYTACAAQLDKTERLANKEHKRKGVWKKVAQVGVVIIITETLLILAQ